MRNVSTAVVLLVVAVPLAVPAGDIQNQLAMNAAACNRAEAAADELARQISAFRQASVDDSALLAAFETSQTAWEAYAQAQVDLLYGTADNPRAAYGSVYPACSCLAREELTTARVEHVKRLLHFQEGDVCSWARTAERVSTSTDDRN